MEALGTTGLRSGFHLEELCGGNFSNQIKENEEEEEEKNPLSFTNFNALNCINLKNTKSF